jgi:hypothetical protein
MNVAPNSGALEIETLLTGGWLFGVVAIQRKTLGDEVELVEVGWRGQCVWNSRVADDWPASLAEAKPHDPDPKCNGAGNDVVNSWAFWKTAVEESDEGELDDHAVSKARTRKCDLEYIPRIPC